MTPDRLLYHQARKAMDDARQDWIVADAEAIAVAWDNQLHRAAIAVRQEAAKRWLAADKARVEAYERMRENGEL